MTTQRTTPPRRLLHYAVTYEIQWRNRHRAHRMDAGWTLYGYAKGVGGLERTIDLIESTDHPKDYDFRVIKKTTRHEVIDWPVARSDQKKEKTS